MPSKVFDLPYEALEAIYQYIPQDSQLSFLLLNKTIFQLMKNQPYKKIKLIKEKIADIPLKKYAHYIKEIDIEYYYGDNEELEAILNQLEAAGLSQLCQFRIGGIWRYSISILKILFKYPIIQIYFKTGCDNLGACPLNCRKFNFEELSQNHLEYLLEGASALEASSEPEDKRSTPFSRRLIEYNYFKKLGSYVKDIKMILSNSMCSYYRIEEMLNYRQLNFLYLILNDVNLNITALLTNVHLHLRNLVILVRYSSMTPIETRNGINGPEYCITMDGVNFPKLREVFISLEGYHILLKNNFPKLKKLDYEIPKIRNQTKFTTDVLSNFSLKKFILKIRDCSYPIPLELSLPQLKTTKGLEYKLYQFLTKVTMFYLSLPFTFFQLLSYSPKLINLEFNNCSLAFEPNSVSTSLTPLSTLELKFWSVFSYECFLKFLLNINPGLSKIITNRISEDLLFWIKEVFPNLNLKLLC